MELKTNFINYRWSQHTRISAETSQEWLGIRTKIWADKNGRSSKFRPKK